MLMINFINLTKCSFHILFCLNVAPAIFTLLLVVNGGVGGDGIGGGGRCFDFIFIYIFFLIGFDFVDTEQRRLMKKLITIQQQQLHYCYYSHSVVPGGLAVKS